LPFTQITCKRTFSKLKNIKIKLRSTISQESIEALLLMNIEKHLEIDKESVIYDLKIYKRVLMNF